MKTKRIIAALLAVILVLPLFSFAAFADTKVNSVKYDNLPLKSLAEMEIDFTKPVASSGNLDLFFIRYSKCAEETITTTGKVVVDALTGMKDAVFAEEIAELRPSGLFVGEFITPVNGAIPDLSQKGLTAGSILTEIDGQAINSVEDYVNIMNSKDVGEEIEATYVRLSSSKKKSAVHTIKDGALNAEKALFMIDFLKNNLKDSELGIYLGEYQTPAGMTDSEFKKLMEIDKKSLATKYTYTIELKKGKGAALPTDIEKKWTGTVTENMTVAEFAAFADEFKAKYDYYTGLRKSGNEVTVRFEYLYQTFEEKTVNFTTGLVCDALFVLDKQNPEKPFLWRATVDETEYDIINSGTVKRWNDLMRSLIVVYADQLRSDVATGSKVTYASGDVSACKTSYRIENGKIIYTADFSAIKVFVEAEFGLKDGSFYAKILNESIKEEGTGESARRITDISILPFFGATNSSKDGYIIVPDGSGMMINFAANVNSIYAKEYVFSVGGSDVLDIDKFLKNENILENVNLPVFGIANETANVGFVAYSKTANAEASVIAAPAGFAVDLYRASLRFRYRYSTDIIGTNIAVGEGNTIASSASKKVVGKKYSEERITNESHEVIYTFLSGENANYSGMANAYRDYLVKNGDLKDNVANEEKLPIVIDFFMATRESQIIFTKIVKMTSFEDAKEIAEDLKANGVANMITKFVGSEQGGYGNYPKIWPLEGALGGEGGAKAFAEFAKANGIKSLLEIETIKANSDVGGFSTKNDIVSFGNSIAVSNSMQNIYYLNAPAVQKKMQDFMGKVKGIGFSGVSINTIGNIIYQNYKGKEMLQNRQDTLNTWDSVMNNIAQNNEFVSAEGASLYTIKYSNLLTEIPTKSSEYHISYKSVPFVQMILHGYVNYTDEPINLFYDQNVQKLKLVEYGCLPYYKITKEATENLKLSEYNLLFSSEYSQWKDDIINFYAKCSEKLNDVWNVPMVYHESDDNIATVRYENGKTLYVNYNDHAVEINGVSVGAYDFEVR